MSTATLSRPIHGHGSPAATLRMGGRLLGFVALCLGEALVWWLTIGLIGRAGCRRARARWLNGFTRRLVRLLGLEVEYEGRPPESGLLVCNHLSYVDVILLSARSPLVFVAKEEVRSWPGLGALVRSAGTLFVNRERRSDVARAGAELADALRTGVPVCVFAEGTSSAGDRVLPFRSSLLAPAIEVGCPVTPVAVGYELEEGSAEDEVCYWGSMTFGPHFLNLLGKPRIFARVNYGQPIKPAKDRKALAAQLHEEVSCLAGLRERAWQSA